MTISYILNPFSNRTAGQFYFEVTKNASLAIGLPYVFQYATKNLQENPTATSLREKNVTLSYSQQAVKYTKIGCRVLLGTAWGAITGLAFISCIDNLFKATQALWNVEWKRAEDPSLATTRDSLQKKQQLLKQLQPGTGERQKCEQEIQNLEQRLQKKTQVLNVERETYLNSRHEQRISTITWAPLKCLGAFFMGVGSLMDNAKSHLSVGFVRQVAFAGQSDICQTWKSSYLSPLLRNGSYALHTAISYTPALVTTAILGVKIFNISKTVFHGLASFFAENQTTQGNHRQSMHREWAAFTDRLHLYGLVAAVNNFVPELMMSTLGNIAIFSSFGMLEGQDPVMISRVLLIVPIAIKTLQACFQKAPQPTQQKNWFWRKSQPTNPSTSNSFGGVVNALGIAFIAKISLPQIMYQFNTVPKGMEFTANWLQQGFDCAVLNAVS